MGRLKRMQDKVEYILEKHPLTRDDDKMLICAVYSHFYNVDMREEFGSVMLNDKLPSFETIRRCRQKVQEENELLRGKRDKDRIDLQKEYLAYAKGE